jgi:hypothetical protein
MKTYNSQKQMNIGIIIIIFIGLIYFIAKQDMDFEERSIDNNKIETVCQVYKFYSNRSFDTYYYRFYFQGKEYFDSQNIHGENEDKCIGKYFKVHFSSKNMKFSKIFLEFEIKDTLQIKKAGFKIN